MKTLIIAEKPSVGRELARVLGCKKSSKSHIEGDKYIVTWAMGHLVELADPGAHDPKFKQWNAEDLPIIPERMKHRVIGRTSRQFSMIKSLMHRKEVNNLIIATDAGREGELVARWVMRLGGYKGPFQRLWISSQTDKAIREGFAALKNGRDYDNLMRAAECRAEADWLIGLNVTRALSCTYDTRLSAGRVQTPSLAMIQDRDEQIRNFKPKPYQLLEADFGGFSASWRGKSGGRIFSGKASAELTSKLENTEAEVVNISEKKQSVPPPLAYDLTALQQDANRALGYSAKQTLKILQGLYERHKIVTYPRTDSRHLTADIEPTIKDRLKALYATDWRVRAEEIQKSSLKPGKRLFDDSRVSDHHAIIPTEETVKPERLSAEEKALWNMIVKRFLAVLSPPHCYVKRSAELRAEGESFFVSSSRVTDEGWRNIEFIAVENGENERSGSGKIDNLKKGQKYKIESTRLQQKQTTPPGHHTEASLLALMEKNNLGTPATRADIIEKLLSNRYMERSGSALKLTPAGEEVLLLVPEQLKSAELTAEWEKRLSRIAEGKEKAGVFSSDIRKNTGELVAAVKSGGKDYKPVEFSKKPCPLCGRMMMPTKDRRGRELYVCRSLSCGYEEEPENRGGYRKPSPKERAVTRKLIKQYSDDSSDTFTLADMINMKTPGKK
ncbi:MAG: DNA topoisomerase 3 [Spirochaetales bacterium]|uniref:DNA topoisomerase n=1 Tax=Candidatus Thalassospirochaeta sargassi TaxID=3119039 RepID=A0AAJ1ICQ4_9SPIO|nr:DNA topoisomerase 3 [Spirochaetales bacterium]